MEGILKYTISSFVVLFVLLGFSASAEAQGASVNHWASSEECQLATGAPYYTPTILSPKPLGEGETVAPHPLGGCFETTVADGSRAWVRFQPNRMFVWKDGVPVRVPECNNPIYGWVPFLDFRDSTGVTALAPVTSIASTPTEGKLTVGGELTLRLAEGGKIELVQKSGVEDHPTEQSEPSTPIRDSAMRQAESADLEKSRGNESFFERNKKGLVIGGVVVAAILTGVALGMSHNSATANASVTVR